MPWLPVVVRPCCSRLAESSARPARLSAPSTTEITVRPLRVAEDTWLKPAAQMKPVFIPSAPSKRPISVLKFGYCFLPVSMPSMVK
ncbi:hypothetical protein D3C87_1637090 [compost metagenome]